MTQTTVYKNWSRRNWRGRSDPPRQLGPREFYRAFAEADECITNSFHAVMFSYICNCNVRFLRPTAAERKDMFARIEEFATTSVKGSFIANDLPAALSSLDSDPRVAFTEDAISARRDFSRSWLADQLSRREGKSKSGVEVEERTV